MTLLEAKKLRDENLNLIGTLADYKGDKIEIHDVIVVPNHSLESFISFYRSNRRLISNNAMIAGYPSTSYGVWVMLICDPSFINLCYQDFASFKKRNSSISKENPT